MSMLITPLKDHLSKLCKSLPNSSRSRLRSGASVRSYLTVSFQNARLLTTLAKGTQKSLVIVLDLNHFRSQEHQNFTGHLSSNRDNHCMSP